MERKWRSHSGALLQGQTLPLWLWLLPCVFSGNCCILKVNGLEMKKESTVGTGFVSVGHKQQEEHGGESTMVSTPKTSAC